MIMPDCVVHRMCVPARKMFLGPGTLLAILLGPGTAFLYVPPCFNPCFLHGLTHAPMEAAK